MSNEPIVGTVLESMPAQNTALVANPFERMALAMVNSGGDMANLEKLLELQQKWDAEQSRKAYDDAMAACQAEMPRVHKNRYNEQTKSWYATLESVVKSAQPVYTAHGFSLSFNTAESKFPHHVLVKCKCSHRAGHSEHFEYDQPLDDAGIAGTKNKTPTHAKGSAVSYGRRYITMMVFNIATTDDDDGNASTTMKKDEKPQAEDAATRKAQHDAALGRHSESVDFIKDRITAKDYKAMTEEWRAIPKDDQMALWLAPTKGGCFTTAERDSLRKNLTSQES